MKFKLTIATVAALLVLSVAVVAACKQRQMPETMYPGHQFYASSCTTNYVCQISVQILDPCTIQYILPSQHHHHQIQVYLVDVNNMYYPIQMGHHHLHQQIDVSNYGFQNLLGLSLHDRTSGAYLGQIDFSNRHIENNHANTQFLELHTARHSGQNQHYGGYQGYGLHRQPECKSGQWTNDGRCVENDENEQTVEKVAIIETPTVLVPIAPSTIDKIMPPTPTPSSNAHLLKMGAVSSLFLGMAILIV